MSLSDVSFFLETAENREGEVNAERERRDGAAKYIYSKVKFAPVSSFLRHLAHLPSLCHVPPGECKKCFFLQLMQQTTNAQNPPTFECKHAHGPFRAREKCNNVIQMQVSTSTPPSQLKQRTRRARPRWAEGRERTDQRWWVISEQQQYKGYRQCRREAWEETKHFRFFEKEARGLTKSESAC
ncbi:hypothetical protein EJ04DRAFT_96700 [Polyplosphaeria fusca]|uniref:Uncharacterized protein n=1 Tax=Polyplosphaeria fusca TaxID=682080 RepID=A0A9P4QP28_9PLEO|nr:hypothetical protein EJ04DRAFT_96700 [Polyplosphaeria fusca]